MFNIVRKEIQYGGDTVILETGQIARQATAAVMVTIGDTQVLVTVVGKKEADPNKPFFPLTVNYQEKTYATGRIPGGFFKREGRPSEKETLTCRLIDRPIRPLFPKGFMNEVQIVATVMSSDKNQDPDIAAMIGTSAALAISGIPFSGPIGAARVGFKDGLYLLNPTYSELEESALNLVVAGTEAAVLMVESEAQELSEDQMLGAVLFGHQEMQGLIQAINEFASEVGTPAWEWQPAEENTELKNAIKGKYEAALADAYTITDKMARQQKVGELRDACVAEFATEEEGAPEAGEVKDLFGKVEKNVVREAVVSGKPRIDGRALNAVRPIECKVGMLKKTHGSALFTRGETQAIVTATLGGMRDAQFIDALEGSRQDHFMLQYNFPPYCVGETGMIGSPKRREIGHGRLARRGVEAVVPDEKQFPYSIRVVSEITESNGSSSMASVCGTSMALMDAGVPLTAPVAGIAMGLVKEEDGRFAVLSDILGDEDHLGDMDFKVAGTARGVTALQMDIKIEGITEEIMEKALEQAQEGRLHILGEMAKAISESRSQVSDNAPTLLTLKINPEKIRDVIGKGGATIRGLTDETGCTIDLEDDGSVKIYGETREAALEAKRRVEELTAEAEIDKIYEGKVMRVVDFGAFVQIMPGTEGLLHISQIAEERVEKVSDYVNEGDIIKVKVLDVDQRGRIKLSMKEAKES
ncbi:polyribonucleotide nucleotidyltransferase [Alloalcanivorax venustensis]|jgi:polyribonucleotide nucleotidyltransferase|uniref:Polyribonucleotide nucleotidyltransferase n=1 Tax=Alloalcanivorax venustensis ISO4 TaxID=1177184 RepID=A0ABS0AC84_9GAMM|nr:polyribonucleotide nucleotidyltransferase [Alloalcanivorax venustensis]MAD69063.1 polyribonucleotide nucleotidyltransferase [Alcanivorax sp.]MCH9783747.1 polyribonucleotide nucleotidyltransferase [Gammaproteobacteria bacterium]MEA3261098.1 polyribonucleotide nucleotidyltransferase [Pseudomonadota bacterium]SMO53868.1 polyribonucleotide nucleotidyltransferase [Alcanivorax sp. DSM 26295]MAK23368.1 polyribonucleotide nucleotidyltransferase [Alcanivorax sp.]|tara:strand:- start:37482 stop:39575 length:2094 start_codon:yes stop_codon:yes gene_type:complete